MVWGHHLRLNRQYFSADCDISFLSSTCGSKTVYPEAVCTCSNFTLFIANINLNCQKANFFCVNKSGWVKSELFSTIAFNLEQAAFVNLTPHHFYMSNEKKTWIVSIKFVLVGCFQVEYHFTSLSSWCLNSVRASESPWTSIKQRISMTAKQYLLAIFAYAFTLF